MTNEEIMIPRWKVIADYPKSLYHVGDILNGGWRSEDCIYCDTDGPRWRHYPHLFRPLEWWEERILENMPQYVRMIKDIEESEVRLGQTLRVIAWHVDEDGKELYFTYDGDPQPDLGAYPDYYAPATEEEYLAQSNV